MIIILIELFFLGNGFQFTPDANHERDVMTGWHHSFEG